MDDFRELRLWLIWSLSIFVLQATAANNEFKQSSHVKHFLSCRLSGFDRENMTATEARCKYECLKGEQVCAAYQWHPETNICQIQDSLHIVPSTAPGDEVGYMAGLKHSALPATCVTDCAEILASDAASESGVYNIFVGGTTLKQVWCDMETDGGGWTVFLKHAVLPLTPVTDCAEILASDAASESGVYTIFAGGTTLKQVWCDMETDGGGWTVFLKRFDGSVDFYRNHAAYKQGFGAADAEHWFGLDALHALTASKTYALRVDVSDWTDTTTFTLHESMSIGDESQDYVLSLGAFAGGDGGNCLLINDGQRFSTYDRELDTIETNCAVHHVGAWWYNGCSKCHPTSKYYTGGSYSSATNDGMQWRTWPKHLDDPFYAMKTLTMKLRP